MPDTRRTVCPRCGVDVWRAPTCDDGLVDFDVTEDLLDLITGGPREGVHRVELVQDGWAPHSCTGIGLQEGPVVSFPWDEETHLPQRLKEIQEMLPGWVLRVETEPGNRFIYGRMPHTEETENVRRVRRRLAQAREEAGRSASPSAETPSAKETPSGGN